ncbi:MAG: HDIG domain-containing protein [Actinomycetota bacterium]|nr:HDIG domain-containing protein [Actinomycetota bacterium]
MSASDALSARLDSAQSVSATREAVSEARAWIVGGAIRDAALGEPVRDLDLALPPGDEKQVARAIAKRAGGYAFPLSERHATWRAVAADDAWHVDVSGLRGETITDDLRARDFAINAVALPLAGGEPVDPTGGLGDAERRLLRAVSERSFKDDPLRLLRAARLASRHDLTLEPGTVRLARAAVAHAADPAPERQFAELRGMLTGRDPIRALAVMDELGVTAAVLPELDGLRGVVQTPNHHLDVHGHTLAVLEQLLEIEAELPPFAGDAAGKMADLLAEPVADEMTRGGALRFGALLHDVGKPATRAMRGEHVTFIGHDRVGAELIASICRRLHTSTRLSDHLQGLALHHLRLGFLVPERPLPRRTVYAYLRATEPVGADVTLLTAADRLAARGEGPIASDEMIEAHLELVREMLPEALAWHRQPPRPPLNGDELAAEIGLTPGPKMGEILEELRAASFAGELSDREAAARRARELAAG